MGPLDEGFTIADARNRKSRPKARAERLSGGDEEEATKNVPLARPGRKLSP